MQAMKNEKARGAGRASFLLAQVGAHAAQKFGERLKPLGFAPYHAGLLRMLANSPGISQQDLAKALRMHASNLVGIVDELEQRGLLERKPSRTDRRVYALHLTDRGRESVAKIGEVAKVHGRTLLAALTETQRMELAQLLEAIAEEQGLASDVHPGFATIRSARREAKSRDDRRFT
jgi:DNA-binding MarR family transcriptional regulator